MIKAGDIVLLNLEPVLGGEKGKTRPCLVLVGSGHPWKIIIVTPITHESKYRSTKLFVSLAPSKKNGLSKASAIDCFQLRCVAQERVVKTLGSVPKTVLSDVRARLANILDIGE